MNRRPAEEFCVIEFYEDFVFSLAKVQFDVVNLCVAVFFRETDEENEMKRFLTSNRLTNVSTIWI